MGGADWDQFAPDANGYQWLKLKVEKRNSQFQ